MMRDERKESYGSRTSELEFLLNKADTSALEEESGDAAFVGQDELAKAFPDMLSGNSFFDHALARLDTSSKFGAAVIRIDASQDQEKRAEHGITGDLCMDVARVVDAVCDSENGIWGRLGNDLFGCYFPGKNAERCVELAGNMRERLLKRRKETISIGIAEYPTINFNKNQISDNALKALDHAGFFGPDSTVSFDAVSLNISGDKLYQNGDIDGAIREFTTALLIDPSNINVRNSLGVCYGILGDYDKAKEEFETAAWLDPEEVMPVYNIGLINMLDDDKEKALEFFLQADSMDKDVFEVAFQIGRLYLETDQPEKGMPFLEKATLLKPDSGIAFRHLGDCFTTMDMTSEAISAYKNSVRHNPNDADALSALGHLFELQGENPEIAMMFCRQSVEISPENGLFRHRLGRLYLKGNRLDDALREFKTARHLGFDSTQHIEEIENLMTDN